MEFNDLTLNDIQPLIDSGQCDLPEVMVRYLEYLETIRSMHQKYKSKAFILNYLVKIRGLNRLRAGELYVDSLNFFYLEHEVKKDAWRNIYAEKLENAADVCWETNDMEGYRRNIVSAAEMRNLGKADPPGVPEELFDRRPNLYNLDPRRFGIPLASRHALAVFIDEIPDINDGDRNRLKGDAGIIDVEFFEYAEDSTNKPTG